MANVTYSFFFFFFVLGDEEKNEEYHHHVNKKFESKNYTISKIENQFLGTKRGKNRSSIFIHLLIPRKKVLSRNRKEFPMLFVWTVDWAYLCRQLAKNNVKEDKHTIKICETHGSYVQWDICICFSCEIDQHGQLMIQLLIYWPSVHYRPPWFWAWY